MRRIRRFRARTLPEAMVQVKLELGPDAIILQTERMRVGGFFGLFGQRMVQVTAGLDPGDQVRRPIASAVMPPPVNPSVGHPMRTELSEIREAVGHLTDRLSLPGAAGRMEPGLRTLFTDLVEGGVQEEIALRLVGRVRNRALKEHGSLGAAREIARAIITQDLGEPAGAENGGHVIALVGPTGVGKSTTLAKLAARLSITKSIAMVTADTGRIGATDQLETYSQMLGVPLEICETASELKEAVQRHANRELILVDTAGRSPRNTSQMAGLLAQLSAIRPVDIYLTLPLTASYRDALHTVEQHLHLGVHRYLFTKWDEAAAPGLIYSLVRKHRRPLSYISTGQLFPDDLVVADPLRISETILPSGGLGLLTE